MKKKQDINSTDDLIFAVKSSKTKDVKFLAKALMKKNGQELLQLKVNVAI